MVFVYLLRLLLEFSVKTNEFLKSRAIDAVGLDLDLVCSWLAYRNSNIIVLSPTFFLAYFLTEKVKVSGDSPVLDV